MDGERWKAAVLQAIYSQFDTNFFNDFQHTFVKLHVN